MQTTKVLRLTLRYEIAAVWLVNGLLCKVLHLVPRHEAIVAGILGPAHAAPLIRLIGVAEIGMAVWILSGRWVRLNAGAQIALVLTMNTLEFWLASDLLLWHQYNSLYAALFAMLVYYYGFVLTPTASLSN